MKLNSLSYYFKEAFSGLVRNRLMTFASIVTVVACIFMMTFSYCIVANIQHILSQIENSIGIAAFLEDDLNADEVNALFEEVKEIDHIEMVTYVSPEEALNEFKEQWDMQEILDGFDEENNPLSKSFEIELDSIENQGSVIAELEKLDGIRNIRHAQSETEILLKVNNAVRFVGIGVMAILAVISVVIIFNTIKISVYTRRNEISIMKYVGATDWFIRWPFVLEGVVIGFTGAIIPMIISWFAYNKIINAIYSYLPFIKNIAEFIYAIDIFSLLLPMSLILGILLGVCGSVASIRKYLRV